MIHEAGMLDRLEREMGVVTRRIRRAIGQRARSVDPELSPGTYLVLTFLIAEGPCRSVAVVEAMGIDKGAVSRQVAHLMDLGLVERTPDPDDGRASLLQPTAEARRRLSRVRRERRSALDHSLAEWSDADLAGFVDQLARYNASLERVGSPDEAAQEPELTGSRTF